MGNWVRLSDLADQLDDATIRWLAQHSYWTGLDGEAIVDVDTLDEVLDLMRLAEGNEE